MLNQEPTCRSKGCRMTKNLFYCHKPDSPRCLNCPDSCSVCNKQRNNPLAEYLKKIATKGSTQCKKCKTQTSKQWLIFSCDHSYCLRCICKNFCLLLKQSVTKSLMNSNAQTIKCECGRSSLLNIGSLLERFCFCCGENLKDKVIPLKFELMMNFSCKIRIHYDSECFSSGKNYIEKSIYEQLINKCKKCNNKIEQGIEREQIDKQSKSICKNCKIISQDVKQEFKQVQTNKAQKNQTIINVKQKEDPKSNEVKKDEPTKQRIISKVQILNQRFDVKKCVTCSREFIKDKVISIRRMYICLECHNNSQKDVKSKNKVQLQESNLMVKKQTIQNKQFSPISKNGDNQIKQCGYCYQFFKAKDMLMQQSECICSKCYKKQQNEQKQNQSIRKFSQPVNQSFQNRKKDKQNTSTSNMGKMQAQRCILCSQKIVSSNKSQKSDQLGCTICNKCQLINGSFYSQKSNLEKPNKIGKNQSQFQLQRQLKKTSSVDRQRIEQQKIDRFKLIKKSCVQKGKLLNFEPFLKTVRLSFQKQKIKNISIKDRQYVRSIVMADVQPYDLMPSIQGDTLISCFICGYFFAQKYSLVQEPKETHKCISCNMKKYNYQ